MTYNPGPVGGGSLEPLISTPWGSVDPSLLDRFPTPPPAQVQFFFNTIGQTIFRSIGTCRLPGQIIWAQGINASGDLLSSSFLTFAACYCAPFVPGENVTITRMWSFGTLIYDVSRGGVVPPGNIDDTTLQYLENCLANLVIYPGDEAQLPNSLIQADKGVNLTNAFRGMRYVVFYQFPLLVANNTVPNINIEWTLSLPSGTSLLVADIFVIIGASQGIVVETDGIDDTCDNFICTSDESFMQIAQRHRAIYNYQIIDRPDGSVLLKRVVLPEMISGNLDFYLNQTDCIVSKSPDGAPQGPAVKFNRIDPSSLPREIEIQYSDKIEDYAIVNQNAVQQYGRLKNGIPEVYASASATQKVSVTSSFGISAAQAITLAYDTLYRLWSETLTAEFEHPDLAIESGDIGSVSGGFGEVVIRVDQQLWTKNRTNQIKATALAVAGPPLVADTGTNVTPGTGFPPPPPVPGSSAASGLSGVGVATINVKINNQDPGGNITAVEFAAGTG
jgi:hypothetical protein